MTVTLLRRASNRGRGSVEGRPTPAAVHGQRPPLAARSRQQRRRPCRRAGQRLVGGSLETVEQVTNPAPRVRVPQLSRHLRVVAFRQRRQDARSWLAAPIVISAALGLRAALGQDWLAAVAFARLVQTAVDSMLARRGRSRVGRAGPAAPAAAGVCGGAAVPRARPRRRRPAGRPARRPGEGPSGTEPADHVDHQVHGAG